MRWGSNEREEGHLMHGIYLPACAFGDYSESSIWEKWGQEESRLASLGSS